MKMILFIRTGKQTTPET